LTASKIEAVKGRGGSDLRFSHDLEDIVFVLSGSSNAWESLESAPKKVVSYLKKEFSTLLKNPTFKEAVGAFLTARGDLEERANRTIEKIQKFSSKTRAT